MLHERFGVEPPAADKLAAPEHTLAAGLAHALRGDAGQRAVIAAALGRPDAQRSAGSVWMPAVLGVLMDDPYDAVRYMAGRALKSLPDVDSSALDYDPVPRPDTRPPFAPRAARLSSLTHQQSERVGQTVTRLLPSRDDRAVMLLE